MSRRFQDTLDPIKINLMSRQIQNKQVLTLIIFSNKTNDFLEFLKKKIKEFFTFINATIFSTILIIIAYFALPYYAPDDNYYCRNSIINSRNPLDIETEIKMIDFYREIRSDLIKKMKEDSQNFFVLEGPSMQGKSTFGKTLYNELIKNSQILSFYIEVDEEDPKNIFKKLEKCSWPNIELVVDKLASEYKQIVFIIDSIQLLFETKKTEILSVFKKMRSSKVQFIFISSANSIIGRLRYNKI